MSIIERALEKQRNVAEETTRAGQRSSVRPPGPNAAGPTATQVARRVPGESLYVDMDALRAAGVLPPEAFADRVTEQFRRVKRPLLESFAGRGTNARPDSAVMITSAIAGEGKTFVSFNLALSIAREKDLDVLLVDADVAKRDLTRQLGAESRGGLTEAAAEAQLDPEQLVLGTGIEGLTFLPSGQGSPHASELFASRRMAEVIEALRRAAPQRIILLDCSPLLATSETAVLASLVDQIVLVVSAESTPQPLVLEAVSLLDRTKQIRCLLNQTRVSHVHEYYYYGYPTNEQPRLP